MAKKKQLQPDVTRYIASFLVIALSIISMGRLGAVGEGLNNVIRFLFGEYPYIYEIAILIISLLSLFKPSIFKQGLQTTISVVLLSLAFFLFMSLQAGYNGQGMSVLSQFWAQAKTILVNSEAYAYSGFIGAMLYSFTSYLFAEVGVIVIVILLVLISFVLLISPRKVKEFKKKRNKQKRERDAKRLENKKEKSRLKKQKLVEKKNTKKSETLEEVEEADDDNDDYVDLESKKSSFITMDEAINNQTKSGQTPIQLKANLDEDAYDLPPLELLDDVKPSKSSASSNQNTAKEKGQRLIEVLETFGIDAEVEKIHIGPAVTKFEIIPDSNVKISKISSIQDNLMMELAVKTLRIEAPIPGKRAVGIEVPNVEMIPVRLKEIIESVPNFTSSENIDVILGKNLMGKPIISSLNKMPHLLVAGATGSGKSVCINSIIVSLLLSKTPDELKLILIDPKKVEFTPFTKIPHLYSPVISDPKEASVALNVLVELMEERYEEFAELGVRNIQSYNDHVKRQDNDELANMPWIVVIIDELADLMSVAGKDVEVSIQRITQLARAAGIHLIVATQRPSVDVVTGIIKANIPSRIAFAVSSAVDSRTILDTSGAEKLLGYGDMLYIPMGEPVATRVQGAFVSDDEIKRVTKFVSESRKPHYHDAFVNLDASDGLSPGLVNVMDDPMYQEALEFIISHRKASTSLLQRRMAIGYNRAARIIDAMEENGVIGPARGSKPREVLVSENALDEADEE